MHRQVASAELAVGAVAARQGDVGARGGSRRPNVSSRGGSAVRLSGEALPARPLRVRGREAAERDASMRGGCMAPIIAQRTHGQVCEGTL